MRQNRRGKFENVADHAAYLREGGCARIIEAFAASLAKGTRLEDVPCPNWMSKGHGENLDDIDNPTWRPLYRTGGIAALLAAILFRRNIGAEVSLFTGVEAIPHSAADWYALLQSNPFVGLSFLAVFDLVDYALVGLIFLALAAASGPAAGPWRPSRWPAGWWRRGEPRSNISLTLFSLSQQYAAATSAAQQDAFLAAGQAVLATGDPLAVYPTAGAYVSLLLIALAGLLFSIILLRSHRAAGTWDSWPAAATCSTA